MRQYFKILPAPLFLTLLIGACSTPQPTYERPPIPASHSIFAPDDFTIRSQSFASSGLVVETGSPEELGALARSDIARYKVLAARLKIEPN